MLTYSCSSSFSNRLNKIIKISQAAAQIQGVIAVEGSQAIWRRSHHCVFVPLRCSQLQPMHHGCNAVFNSAPSETAQAENALSCWFEKIRGRAEKQCCFQIIRKGGHSLATKRRKEVLLGSLSIRETPEFYRCKYCERKL